MFTGGCWKRKKIGGSGWDDGFNGGKVLFGTGTKATFATGVSRAAGARSTGVGCGSICSERAESVSIAFGIASGGGAPSAIGVRTGDSPDEGTAAAGFSAETFSTVTGPTRTSGLGTPAASGRSCARTLGATICSARAGSTTMLSPISDDSSGVGPAAGIAIGAATTGSIAGALAGREAGDAARDPESTTRSK